ncbi:MAG: HAD family hydrolase [Ignavibacteria bacterium]
MSKAIFLDRDGTINQEINYLTKKEDIVFYPNTIKALQIFKNSGFLNIIITNQSGIARGFLTENDLNTIHKEFRKLLTANNQELIDDIFYSPFHIDGIIEHYKTDSADRKPGTGMIHKAKAKYNIELQESFLVGDSLSDMQCAVNAGVKNILVETGYGKRDLENCKMENLKIDYFAKDLYDAACYVSKIKN